MRRFLFISFLLIAALLIISLGTVWYLSGDEEFLKSRLNRIAQAQTGRSLIIEGPLRLTLGRVTEIEAENIRFSNADWAQDKDMVRIGHLLAAIDLPSLWSEGPFKLPKLAIDSCQIFLLENEDGEANWDLLPAQEPEEQPVTDPREFRGPAVLLPDLMIQDCRLELESPQREEKLVAEVGKISLHSREDGRVEGNGLGRVNSEELEFNGWVEPARAFIDGGSLEHHLELRLGDIAMQSAGSFADAKSLAGANISGHFRGPQIGSVLQAFAAPALSEGAFDFRYSLNSEGGLTRIEIDGDLGSLDAKVRGELDRLLQPQAGTVELEVTGSDLGAVGQAFDVDGLVSEAYRLEAQAVFEQGMIRLDAGSLETAQDRLEFDGLVTTAPGLAGSDLNVNLRSDEIGRWAPVLGQEVVQAGALSLQGRAAVDAAGKISIDAGVGSGDSSLTAVGTLGTLDAPFTPELNLKFQSPDPSSLAALAGSKNFPAVPLSAEGHLGISDRQIRMKGVSIDLEGHNARVDGVINLAEGHAGSELDFRLDSKDIAGLGALFGLQDLPSQPLSLAVAVKPEGDGMAFKVADGNFGRIQLEAEGRIADLDNPLGMDADFDISLPSLRDLALLVPEIPLPDKPFSARGHFVNRDRDTSVEHVELALGQSKATVNGTIGPQQSLDLVVAVNGPDVSEWQDLLGQPLRPEPFALESRISGDFTTLELTSFNARLGNSRLQGQAQLGFGEITRVAGKFTSEFLDLSQWTPEGEEEATEVEEPTGSRQYLFDDRPVMRIADYGLDLDLNLDLAMVNVGNGTIEDVRLGLRMNPQYLQLKPFSLRGRTGETIFGELTLDGREQTPRVELNIHGRDVTLGLAGLEGQDPSTMPPHEIDLALTGSGVTRRELVSGLDGRLRWYVGAGDVAHAAVSVLFSDFITELFTTLNPFVEKSEYTRLDCAVAAADIVSGRVEVSPVILHTRELSILSQGTIDLDTEAIDLTFNTKPRQGLGLSAGVLINPFIKVGGRLVAPAVELDPKGTVVSGGIAVATAGLSLLAKSMSDRFLSSKDPCGDARREIEKRDGA